ncbi:MAG: response regulator [Vicinamibacteria bacterium]|nr:response regulator [Vicinamibacteria bacterium]
MKNKILLVDDEEEIGKLLCAILASREYEVTVAQRAMGVRCGQGRHLHPPHAIPQAEEGS